MKTIPELLAPAGGERPLTTALRFGADAVYFGAKQYGLRAQAGNFDMAGVERAAAMAHAAGARAFLTLNIFAADGDLPGMADTARAARDAGVDAVIVSDLGAIDTIARAVPGLAVHVSTQASTTNSAAARVYRRMGASRVVLARELTLAQIERMAQELHGEIELEAFVHGAMCMAYSGRCMLSAAMTGRSANRGACTQPCRWTYALTERTRPGEAMPVEQDEHGTAILSAYDLCMMEHLPRLADSGLASLKIEGRMKNELYVGTVVGAYRRSLDAYARDSQAYAADDALRARERAELDKISHRIYDTGFYFGQPAQGGGAAGTVQAAEYMAYVVEVSGGEALVEMKNRFFVGDALEAVTPAGSRPLAVEDIRVEATGEHVGAANIPGQLVRIPCPDWLERGDMLRGPVRNRK